uniref:Protein Wnt n=1 Tax=Eupentacta fraudatrix TaxID=1774088 RepID=A0A165U2S3_9ECHN|nr:WntA [Eupentacta fraudatrix]
MSLSTQGFSVARQMGHLSNSAEDFCNSNTGFIRRQIRFCKPNPDLIRRVEKGPMKAIAECPNQFMNERWNCPLNNITAVFGTNKLRTRNREMSFLQSVVSAGIMFHVTRSCESGDIYDCGCDYRFPETTEPTGDWEWGGCSDNIRYGMYFSRQFVDASRDGEKSLDAMMKHNYEAGRQLISNNMGIKCKCYGVSASCTSQVCWNSMPKLREISSLLTSKHRQAHHVNFSKRKDKLSPTRRESATKHDLVYLMNSPNYCEPSKKHGSVGTHGRLCNKTSGEEDGCSMMCCGRGHQSLMRTVTESCHCRFHWCCFLECETCTRQEELNLCN